MLSGSVADVPPSLLAQLKIGGRLVAIVGQLPIMRARLTTRRSEHDFCQRRSVRYGRAQAARLRRAKPFQLLMQQIDVTALQDFVAAEAADRRPVLLDVREPWEVALGRIELPGRAAARSR